MFCKYCNKRVEPFVHTEYVDEGGFIGCSGQTLNNGHHYVEEILLHAIHIPLAPFDSPTGTYRLRDHLGAEALAFGDYTPDELNEVIQPVPLQRKAGSHDDRISPDKQYLAKIHGFWSLGRFNKVWFGWSFHGYSMACSYQLDGIEDLYEIDLGQL